MSGANAFQLLERPQQQIQRHNVQLTQHQIAVVNLLFILYEYSHLLDDTHIHDNASLLIKELYYVGDHDVHEVKQNFIYFLKQKYDNDDPFLIIIQKLMEIFDFEDEAYPYHLFKQGMGTNNYTNAMNSLRHLFVNRMSLPVSLPKCSLPPKEPNEWVQKEFELMDDIKDALTAEMAVDDANSAADLPFSLQYYDTVFRHGIVKLNPLFDHARTHPGTLVNYYEIKDSFKNALKKVQKLLKVNSVRERSRSPIGGPRRSARIKPPKGGRKIKTVRRHNPNKIKFRRRRN